LVFSKGILSLPSQFLQTFKNYRFENFDFFKKTPEEVYIMLIIDSKDCENIDKALKKYKKKFEKSKTLLQLRERQAFTKPSVVRRGQVLKAIYKQQIASGKIEG
jgi:small subunit ribosomal protein S21